MPDDEQTQGVDENADDQTQPGTHPIQRFLERGEVIILLAGFGSFLLSFATLGLVPILSMRQQIRQTTPKEFAPFTALEAAGFQSYARNGCGYCHSQLVRTLPSDIQLFGVPAEAWEFQKDYPHQWGTRRIGPDLSRESGKRSDAWQYAHLYNPRSTVPQSVMPGFPWMFTRSADGQLTPDDEARAIVAYLNYLGRAMREAGPQTSPDPAAMYGVKRGH
jgi:cbb3-type cytochrome c oxidase subunit II